MLTKSYLRWPIARSSALRAGLRQQGMDFFLRLPGTYSLARAARLGNIPGYYRPSLAGLGHFSPADSRQPVLQDTWHACERM